jgi:hypothetical protein
MYRFRNKIILCYLLIAGIISMLYPSFAIDVLAANGDYAKLGETYSSGYYPPYHSNLNDQTIECIDNNVNINGIDVTKLSSPNHRDLINELQSTESEDAEPQDNGFVNNFNLDKNLVNICANLNLNEQTIIVEQPPGAGEQNIYVLWVDESNGGDEDIFFTVSHDNGQTFATPTDLSDNDGASFEPQMIVAGNNVYVVWQDESDGGEIDIFFTVSHDNGQTFVNPPTNLSNNPSFSERQQMIVSGNNVYVVWRDESNGGDTDILFTVSHDNGQTFVDPPIDLSDNDGGSAGQQMIVSGNNVYVVWEDQSDGDFDIFFTVSHDNGQTFVNPPTDLSNNTGDSRSPQMIVSGNNVYVMWIDDSNGGDEDIFFTVSHDNGQTFATPTDLSDNDERSFNPQMIVAGNNVYVVWQDNSNGPDSDILFTVSHDNGQTFVNPPIDLSDNTGESGINASHHMIVSGNNVYVVWQDDSSGPDSDIFFTVSHDNGQTFVNPPIDLSDNDGLSQDLQMIVSGNNVYVVWIDDSSGPDFDIFFTVSHDNGQTFVNPPTDLSNNIGNSVDTQMRVSGNNVYVMWIDDSNGGFSNIFFTVSHDNGQTFVQPPTDLSNNAVGGINGRPQIIASGNNVYVVWINADGDDDIFFTVSNDNGQTFIDPPTDLSNNTGNSELNQMIVQ